MIIWPPYSPDLNPIEKIWDWMKDYIENVFSEQMTYAQLRIAVKEAWDSITSEQLKELIDSMHAHCQAVIDVNDNQISYWFYWSYKSSENAMPIIMHDKIHTNDLYPCDVVHCYNNTKLLISCLTMHNSSLISMK